MDEDGWGAGLEPIAWNLRIGPKYRKHGDPYEFACTVTRAGDTAELTAGSGVFTSKVRRAIWEQLRAIGIKVVIWARRNDDGTFRDVETTDK